ncbi:hypothetical protein M426DRAFT_59505 [Hypoxylon sp. CI-4A]|nr:hypothetical protein M426DRAFT_59505 [Hypoxylon sp. CI-4A]
MEPIAVVGMGCRFPGTATSPSALWEMLQRGENAWSEIPESRLNISSYFHPSGNRQGSIPFRAGHFLEQYIGAFDSSFFSIPADEAKAIDPQQRILLEVAVEALDNAGVDRVAIKKSDTGVWVGSFVKVEDYEQIVLRDPDDSPKYGATGNGIAIMSNRISFFLDINGPSMTIDTGCSASLVCLHNACQSLRSREVDVGLAGGAGLILTPNTMMPMTALNFLSPDGKCFTFDARANGYGRGEGIGIVVLKRLEDAIRDNDNIRAVIRGSSVNQDGRTPGITLPSAEAQLRNIKSVYKKAGLPVEDTAYVECHGTGTQAGDWRELKAISDGFCQLRSPDDPIYVGSVKTNIGHLEGCAGIAGVIKGVLTIENGLIPKHLNFVAPGNPAIDFDGWKVKVPIENTPWPVEGLRRASINCFGFGGTNAHIIMDDAANYLAERGLIAHHNTAISSQSDSCRIPQRDSRTHLFVFSANEQKGLSQMLKDYTSYATERVGASNDLMEDLAYTLGCRRTKMPWRASVVARSPIELVQKLTDIQPADFVRTSDDKTAKLAFVFGGQGAQWFGMGRELLGFDVFLQSIIQATSYLQTHADSSFNLLAELLKDEDTSRINEPEVSQPATTAIQVALVDMLTTYFGVIPSSVCGHSSGEIAAAYTLGALSREDAWELAFHRGRCAGALSTSEAEGDPEGGMLAVGLSASEAQKYVDQLGNDRVVVACINSPTSVTLSGDIDSIIEVQKVIQADGVFNRLLIVNIGYHSHHMKRYTICLGAVLADTPPIDEIPVMYSSVTGTPISWEQLGPDYWARNMVSPVLFADAMHQMVNSKSSDKPNAILELSAHAALQSPVSQILDGEEKLGQRPSYISMLRRGKDAAVTALEAVGWLWSNGYHVVMPWVVMRNMQVERPRLLVDLPKYPWNHNNVHWHESHLSRANRFQVHGRYDLIGRPTADSNPFQPRWRGFFRLSENPWIQDHQVQKTMIYPAAGMITMVLEAAKQMVPEDFSGIEITQFKIQKAMIIPATERGLEYVLGLNKRVDQSAVASSSGIESSVIVFGFGIYSKQLYGPWEEHGSGFVTIHRRQPAEGARAEHQVFRERFLQADSYYQDYLDVKNTCDEPVIPRQLYETLDVIGLNYGPLFQNISSLHKRDGACVGVIRVPDTKAVMPANFEYPHLVHPTTLDSIFQTAFAMSSEPMVPSFLGSFYISADSYALSKAGGELAAYARADRRGLRDATACFTVSDNTWLDASGMKSPPLIEIKDLVFTALTPSLEGGFLPNHRNLCSEIVWENLEPLLIPNEEEEARKKSVLILIPTGTSPGISALSTELAKMMMCCKIRTLDSVGKDETLPEFCISLVEADGCGLLWSWRERDFLAFRKVVASTRAIFWVTRASQLEAKNPQSSLIQALSRTIRSEDPRKKFVTFDMDSSTSLSGTSAVSTAQTIMAMLERSVFESKKTEPVETEYAERNGEIKVPRLIPVNSLNSMIERGSTSIEPVLQLMPTPPERPLKLEIGEIGNVGSLYWRDDLEANVALSPDEVRIRVIASTLTDLDRDILQGRTRKDSLGTDVYGVVEEIGTSVLGVGVGDYVVGVARGSLKDYVKCHYLLVHPMTENQFDPHRLYNVLGFSIARYALRTCKAGDAILIHEGAGLFGQAAVQLAKSAGAEVFASAETNHQRGILSHFWKLPEDHILDARADSFVGAILRLTNNQGVDIIYDPAAQNRDLNARCIKEGGVVFGFAGKPNKNDTAAHQAEATGKTFSCTILNVSQIIKHSPLRLGHAIASIWNELVSGQFKIWHSHADRAYEYSELASAFAALESDGVGAQVCYRQPTSKPVPILPHPHRLTSDHVRGDVTYVLSGGLGGLGLVIAKLLASNGAKHIAFLSRTGKTSELAKSCLDFLHNRGVDVRIFQVDICDREALANVSSEMQQSMPQVKGIFQCAAVLRDSVFDNMTYEDWQVATRPKTVGSWNLHQVLGTSLDFFVFLSSSAGVIGNRGQANYAVGNAFQDSLARHINTISRGIMHAVSIDLGPVLGAGMLAEDPLTLDKLKASGFFGIRLEDFKRIVECAITGYAENDEKMPAQVVTGVGTGGLIRQNKPADPYWTRTAMFTHLNEMDLPVGPGMDSEDAAELQEAMHALLARAEDAEEALGIVSKGLRVMLSKSMNMDAADVDASRPPSAYGVDSLVAVGVRNWVFRECEVDVSIFEVLSETSIDDLSAIIVQRRGEQ